MLKDILKVKPLKDFHLHLEFEDAVKGEVDIRKLIKFKGVFEPLKGEYVFTKVKVNPEWGTIFWPKGVDLDPQYVDKVYAPPPASPTTNCPNQP